MKRMLRMAESLFKLGVNPQILALAALALAFNMAAAGANLGVSKDRLSQRGEADFAVQVGSYDEIAPANERAARLRSDGLDVRVVKAEIRGRGTWYRVQAGRFASRDEASRYGAALLTSGATREYIVTNFTAASLPEPPPLPAIKVSLGSGDFVWVSTRAREDTADNTPARILLTDGRTIWVDEVWEDPKGIWYRRSGVVAFLHRSSVIAVQRNQ